MKELEWKSVLDRSRLEKIRVKLGDGGRSYIQINYYFDTPDGILARQNEMLRVRQVGGKLLAQYKSRRGREGSLMCCEESEVPLQTLPCILNPSVLFLSAPALNCVLLGNLVTVRTDFFRDGAVISLDESYYLGQEDFEIEIECPRRETVFALARWLELEPNAAERGKYFRFRSAYGALTCNQIRSE